MLHHSSVTSPLMRYGILRPQQVKHFDRFSDDFPGDFGVIFGGVLPAAMIGF
jgi:hypothetical protein